MYFLFRLFCAITFSSLVFCVLLGIQLLLGIPFHPWISIFSLGVSMWCGYWSMEDV